MTPFLPRGIRSLAQLRLTNAQYLTYGRLMHPPNIGPSHGGHPLPTLSMCTQTYGNPPLHCCNDSAVVGHLWLAADGSLGLAVANTAAVSLSVTFTLRVDTQVPFEVGDRVRVALPRDEADGAFRDVVVGAAGLQVHKQIPALSACVVQLALAGTVP